MDPSALTARQGKFPVMMQGTTYQIVVLLSYHGLFFRTSSYLSCAALIAQFCKSLVEVVMLPYALVIIPSERLTSLAGACDIN